MRKVAAMSLSIGIVGLPNAGKSTIFNALTRAHRAEAANYPFCTIEPNKAIVPVPDERVEKVAELTNPKTVIHSTIEFVDIAGLVKGANQGEGLGNKFLSHIRETDAILHVVRCFTDDNVAHVEGTVDPARDIEIVETELLLADVETAENRVHKLQKQVRGDNSLKPVLELAERLHDHLSEGLPAAAFGEEGSEKAGELLKEIRLLTGKPVIYCANADENSMSPDAQVVRAVASAAEARNAPWVTICAEMEEELFELADEERAEFLAAYGIGENGLAQTVRTGFSALGLISFITTMSDEVKSWTVRQGCKAPQAAGTIHTDFERGFIRAHVTAYEDFVANGGESACRAVGLVHEEGKDYEIRDGDVIRFLFNV